MLHAVDAGSADTMRTGHAGAGALGGRAGRAASATSSASSPPDDAGDAARAPADGAEADVTMVTTPIRLHYTHSASPEESRLPARPRRGPAARPALPGAAARSTCRRAAPARPTACRPTDEVELPDRGTVTTFCVVNVPFLGQRIKPPYVAAYVLLDGADIAVPAPDPRLRGRRGADGHAGRGGVEAARASGAPRWRTSTTSGRPASRTRRTSPTPSTCESRRLIRRRRRRLRAGAQRARRPTAPPTASRCWCRSSARCSDAHGLHQGATSASGAPARRTTWPAGRSRSSPRSTRSAPSRRSTSRTSRWTPPGRSTRRGVKLLHRRGRDRAGVRLRQVLGRRSCAGCWRCSSTRTSSRRCGRTRSASPRCRPGLGLDAGLWTEKDMAEVAARSRAAPPTTRRRRSPAASTSTSCSPRRTSPTRCARTTARRSATAPPRSCSPPATGPASCAERPAWITGIAHRVESAGARRARPHHVAVARRPPARPRAARRRRGGRAARAVHPPGDPAAPGARARRRGPRSTRPAARCAGNPMFAAGLARIGEAARRVHAGDAGAGARARHQRTGAAAEPRLRHGGADEAPRRGPRHRPDPPHAPSAPTSRWPGCAGRRSTARWPTPASDWPDIDAVVLGKAPDLFEGVMMPELILADAIGATGKPLLRVHTAGSVGGSTGHRGRAAWSRPACTGGCSRSRSRSSRSRTRCGRCRSRRRSRCRSTPARAATSRRTSAPTSAAPARRSTSARWSR